MSLLDGITKMGKEAVGFATAPLRTGAKILGTGLETSGKVVTDLAQGDVGAAASDYVGGLGKQVKNVTSYPGEQLGHLKGVAEGYGDYLSSGARLIGEPVRGVARLAGNGLETAGQTTTQLANGNLGGAIETQVQGTGNAFGILGDTAQNQWNNLAG